MVRDPAIHRAVCARIQDWWSRLARLDGAGITESPITGPEGNREFLIAAAAVLAAANPSKPVGAASP